jgi:hypothetical protein
MAELAFATVTVLKEVYLLSRFVARTAKSAKHASAERSSLQDDLDYEHLYIRSFGLLFFQNNGAIVPHEHLNAEWLEKIKWILNGLRLAEADYAKLAAERDSAYGTLSPFLAVHEGDHEAHNGLIEFGEFDRAATSMTSHSTDEQLVSTGTSSQSAISLRKRMLSSMDWRWALSEKKQLEIILATSQKWTRKLKELVQLTMAVNQQYHLSQSAAAIPLAENDDAKRLGLTGHVRLRQHIEAALTGVDDLELKDASVDLPKQRTTLTPAILRQTDTVESVLVEMKPLPEVVSDTDETNIIRLAQLLALSSGTNLSTIPLRGFLKLEDENAYAFVFGFPPKVADKPPVTLFDLIRRPHSVTQGLALPQRFRVAQSVAKSLNALHADEWVHKSFRSRSIVFFRGTRDIVVEKPYLVDFEFSRSTTSATSWTYDDDLEKNLYRHPLRQRPPQKSFDQSHDLYALGVVLLEIGLWRTASSVKEQAQATLEPGEVLDPETLSEYYVQIAERDLAHTMGKAYADATVTCLRGSFNVKVTDASFPLVVYDSVVHGLDPKRLLDDE